MDGNSLTDGERQDARDDARTTGQKWRRWWMRAPERVRRYGMSAFGCAVVAAVYAWEARNATLGFVQEFDPGLFWAIVGAMGASGASLLCWRWAMESFRAVPKSPDKIFPAVLALIMALLATAILLYGVWSNFAADGVRRDIHADEHKVERESLAKDMRALEGDIRSLPSTIEIGLEADRESLRKVQNLGRQWELPKLDNNAGGDCDTDLKPYPRSLCNQAADLRGDIATAEASITQRASLQKQLDEKRVKLDKIGPVQGTEEYDVLAQAMKQEGNKHVIQGIAKAILSLAFLLLAMFLFDRVLEGRGKKPPEAVQPVGG